MIVLICLVGADHPVIVVDSLIQRELIDILESVRAVPRTKRRDDFRLASIYFYSKLEFSNHNNNSSCCKSTKDCSSGSKTLALEHVVCT